MDSATLAQIKELGLPAFSVIILILTAAFMIRSSITERRKALEREESTRKEVNEIINKQQIRNDEIQKSFTNQLLSEQALSKQREVDLLKQLTQTNQRVVELQLEIGQIRLEQKQSLVAIDVLTKERDKKAAEYETESQARKSLEGRVAALESDLERSKKERRDLSDKYTQLKKEHDALVDERNKLVSDMAALKRQTQTNTIVS